MREHLFCADSEEAFRAINYGTTTTSKIEYFFVVAPTDKSLQACDLVCTSPSLTLSDPLRPSLALQACGIDRWPFEETLETEPRDPLNPLRVRRKRRRPHPPSWWARERSEVSSQLQKLDTPPLMEEEFVAARLYTGPMFFKVWPSPRPLSLSCSHALALCAPCRAVQQHPARHQRPGEVSRRRVAEAVPRERVHDDAAHHQQCRDQAEQDHQGGEGLPRHLGRAAARVVLEAQRLQRARRRRVLLLLDNLRPAGRHRLRWRLRHRCRLRDLNGHGRPRRVALVAVAVPARGLAPGSN